MTKSAKLVRGSASALLAFGLVAAGAGAALADDGVIPEIQENQAIAPLNSISGPGASTVTCAPNAYMGVRGRNSGVFQMQLFARESLRTVPPNVTTFVNHYDRTSRGSLGGQWRTVGQNVNYSRGVCTFTLP